MHPHTYTYGDLVILYNRRTHSFFTEIYASKNDRESVALMQNRKAAAAKELVEKYAEGASQKSKQVKRGLLHHLRETRVCDESLFLESKIVMIALMYMLTDFYRIFFVEQLR